TVARPGESRTASRGGSGTGIGAGRAPGRGGGGGRGPGRRRRCSRAGSRTGSSPAWFDRTVFVGSARRTDLVRASSPRLHGWLLARKAGVPHAIAEGGQVGHGADARLLREASRTV